MPPAVRAAVRPGASTPDNAPTPTWYLSRRRAFPGESGDRPSGLGGKAINNPILRAGLGLGNVGGAYCTDEHSKSQSPPHQHSKRPGFG